MAGQAELEVRRARSVPGQPHGPAPERRGCRTDRIRGRGGDRATPALEPHRQPDVAAKLVAAQRARGALGRLCLRGATQPLRGDRRPGRSEEHTSELQSLAYLVCRLLLEKKKKIIALSSSSITTEVTRSGNVLLTHS